MEEIDMENGEAHVETDGLTVQEQVKRAYADAVGRDNGYDDDERCLSFLTDRWLDPEEAANLVTYVGPYNNFDPEIVAMKIQSVAENCEFLRVAIGREGSPALYFEVNPVDRPEVEHAFERYADEFAEVEPPDISGKEMKRGDEYPIEEHSSCRHENPPVEPGNEAKGSTEYNRVYIRSWWD